MSESDKQRDVTSIDGIGEDSANALADIGINSVSELATADTETVSDAAGFGDVRAEEAVESANETLWSDTGDTDATDDVDAQVGTVELPDDHDTVLYVIHLMLEESVRRQQSNAYQMRDEAMNIAEHLMRVLISTEDADTVDLTEDELDVMYVALNRGWQDYASRPGIGTIWEDIKNLSEDIHGVRTETEF